MTPQITPDPELVRLADEAEGRAESERQAGLAVAAATARLREELARAKGQQP